MNKEIVLKDETSLISFENYNFSNDLKKEILNNILDQFNQLLRSFIESHKNNNLTEVKKNKEALRLMLEFFENINIDPGQCADKSILSELYKDFVCFLNLFMENKEIRRRSREKYSYWVVFYGFFKVKEFFIKNFPKDYYSQKIEGLFYYMLNQGLKEIGDGVYNIEIIDLLSLLNKEKRKECVKKIMDEIRFLLIKRDIPKALYWNKALKEISEKFPEIFFNNGNKDFIRYLLAFQESFCLPK